MPKDFIDKTKYGFKGTMQKVQQAINPQQQEKEEVAMNEQKNQNDAKISEPVKEEKKTVTVEKIAENDPYIELFDDYKIGTVIKCSSLRIRKEPSADAEILTEVKLGDTLKYKESGISFSWLSVELDDGTRGYCMAEYIGE